MFCDQAGEQAAGETGDGAGEDEGHELRACGGRPCTPRRSTRCPGPRRSSGRCRAADGRRRSSRRRRRRARTSSRCAATVRSTPATSPAAKADRTVSPPVSSSVVKMYCLRGVGEHERRRRRGAAPHPQRPSADHDRRRAGTAVIRRCANGSEVGPTRKRIPARRDRGAAHERGSAERADAGEGHLPERELTGPSGDDRDRHRTSAKQRIDVYRGRPRRCGDDERERDREPRCDGDEQAAEVAHPPRPRSTSGTGRTVGRTRSVPAFGSRTSRLEEHGDEDGDEEQRLDDARVVEEL